MHDVEVMPWYASIGLFVALLAGVEAFLVVFVR